jgi:hypothetical protein
MPALQALAGMFVLHGTAQQVLPWVRSVEEASKLLASGAGNLNLQLAAHKLSRSSHGQDRRERAQGGGHSRSARKA